MRLRVVGLLVPVLATLLLAQTLLGFTDSAADPANDQDPSAVVAPEAPEVVAKPAEHETIAASKETIVKDGVTYGDLVHKLGPASSVADADEVRWYFDDTAVLGAKPSAEADIMHFGTEGKIWWVTSPPEHHTDIVGIVSDQKKLMHAVSTVRGYPNFDRIFFGSVAAVSVLVLTIVGRWYWLKRTKHRAISGRLFRVNKRLPGLGPQHESSNGQENESDGEQADGGTTTA